MVGRVFVARLRSDRDKSRNGRRVEIAWHDAKSVASPARPNAPRARSEGAGTVAVAAGVLGCTNAQVRIAVHTAADIAERIAVRIAARESNSQRAQRVRRHLNPRSGAHVHLAMKVLWTKISFRSQR